jgi:hypothetical protein
MTDRNRRTAAMVAAGEGQLATLEMLLEKGEDFFFWNFEEEYL